MAIHRKSGVSRCQQRRTRKQSVHWFARFNALVKSFSRFSIPSSISSIAAFKSSRRFWIATLADGPHMTFICSARWRHSATDGWTVDSSSLIACNNVQQITEIKPGMQSHFAWKKGIFPHLESTSRFSALNDDFFEPIFSRVSVRIFFLEYFSNWWTKKISRRSLLFCFNVLSIIPVYGLISSEPGSITLYARPQAAGLTSNSLSCSCSAPGSAAGASWDIKLSCTPFRAWSTSPYCCWKLSATNSASSSLVVRSATASAAAFSAASASCSFCSSSAPETKSWRSNSSKEHFDLLIYCKVPEQCRNVPPVIVLITRVLTNDANRKKTSHIRQLWIQQETDCKTHWTQLKREWQIRNDLCGSIYGIFQPADGSTGATYVSHSTDVCLRVGSNSSSGRLVRR